MKALGLTFCPLASAEWPVGQMRGMRERRLPLRGLMSLCLSDIASATCLSDILCVTVSLYTHCDLHISTLSQNEPQIYGFMTF
jgi:hypothetical protein